MNNKILNEHIVELLKRQFFDCIFEAVERPGGLCTVKVPFDEHCSSYFVQYDSKSHFIIILDGVSSLEVLRFNCRCFLLSQMVDSVLFALNVNNEHSA